MKILLIGASIRRNFGGPSLLLSTITVLKKAIPDAKFVFMSPDSADSMLNAEEYELERILVLPRKNILKRISFMIKQFREADVIVDIWGICFTDKFSKSFLSKILEGLHFLIGKCLRKPVIKYTSDMGPFNNVWNRVFAKIFLNRADLILARSDLTKQYIQKMGITTPIYTCPDTAFILAPLEIRKENIIPPEKLGRKIVGFSVSHTITRFEQVKGNYVKLMSKIINCLIKEKKVYVIIIPNEIYLDRHDDVYIGERIVNMIEDKDNVLLLKKEYSARELKGIIKLCDLFIGSRYHSIVAALSLGIPTVAISWHHKYHEVMKLMGLEKFVCDVNNLNFTEIYKKINDMWKNREIIRANMMDKIHFIRKRVLDVGKKVKVVVTDIKNEMNSKNHF